MEGGEMELREFFCRLPSNSSGLRKAKNLLFAFLILTARSCSLAILLCYMCPGIWVVAGTLKNVFCSACFHFANTLEPTVIAVDFCSWHMNVL